MNAWEPFVVLATSIGLGLMVGLEREASEPSAPNRTGILPAGVRTFALISLIGAATTWAGAILGFWLVGLAFTTIGLLLLANYVVELRSHGDRGLTNEMATLGMFLMGVVCALQTPTLSLGERILLATSGSITITALLSTKHILHSFARGLTREDISSSLKLLILGIIAVPWLPDRTIGPFDAINPRHVGWMVLLIATTQFGGYVAMRLWGANRGLSVVGLLGGLVSSTAVTLTMAGWTKKKPSLAVPCAMAIVLASTMMLGRILVEIGVVYPPLLTWALPALGAVIVVACATVVWMRYKHKTESTPSESLELNNPFRLGPALKFAGLYAAVLLAAKALTHWFGNAGTFGIAILSGTTDVDAITLTMANMALSGPHAGGVTPQVATTAILLAAACNTFVKAGMAMVLAGRALIQTVLYALMPVAGALLLAAAVVFWGA